MYACRARKRRARRGRLSLTVLLSLAFYYTARADADGGRHVVSAQQAPLERWFDGTIEAVNQGTVSAQTAGRVEQRSGRRRLQL